MNEWFLETLHTKLGQICSKEGEFTHLLITSNSQQKSQRCERFKVWTDRQKNITYYCYLLNTVNSFFLQKQAQLLSCQELDETILILSMSFHYIRTRSH